MEREEVTLRDVRPGDIVHVTFTGTYRVADKDGAVDWNDPLHPFLVRDLDGDVDWPAAPHTDRHGNYPGNVQSSIKYERLSEWPEDKELTEAQELDINHDIDKALVDLVCVLDELPGSDLRKKLRRVKEFLETGRYEE